MIICYGKQHNKKGEGANFEHAFGYERNSPSRSYLRKKIRVFLTFFVPFLSTKIVPTLNFKMGNIIRLSWSLNYVQWQKRPHPWNNEILKEQEIIKRKFLMVWQAEFWVVWTDIWVTDKTCSWKWTWTNCEDISSFLDGISHVCERCCTCQDSLFEDGSNWLNERNMRLQSSRSFCLVPSSSVLP